ncbi:MAG TPA: GNAT family N-acetyltransferase, partial [Ktedonobacteraceae bacterium]
MQVRILNEKDAEAFWKIRLRALQENPESFGASYEEILERGIAGTAQGLGRREGTPENVTFGAFDEKGQLVGLAGFRRQEEAKKRHKGVIWGMYVPNELRKQGIGKALLEAAIEYAKS